MCNKIFSYKKGFSLVEVIVSVAIVSVLLLLIGSFLFQLNVSHRKSKADRETLENARRIVDEISYEIRGAQSVYAPTTTTNQLSLQTLRYLPQGEETTFIDFFLCGQSVCMKKEGQSPAVLHAQTISVTELLFTRIVNGANSSIKIQLGASYKNPGLDASGNASVNVTSTVALRNY